MIIAQIRGHDRILLGRIFRHTTSHNLEWREVVAFVGRIGCTEEKRGDEWGITLAGRGTRRWTGARWSACIT